MASNVPSDPDTGHGSGYEKSLLWLSDDVLVMTLINLTLEERIGIERTSKRIKAVLDRILSLQKIFAIRLGMKKSVLMKSWSPLRSHILCSKAAFIYDTLPWRGESSSLSILSRCSSVKLVNLEFVDVRGTDLATWCPLITHFVTDKMAKAADYAQELIMNKKDVLIESLEYRNVTSNVYVVGQPEPDIDRIVKNSFDPPLPTESDPDFSFLSNCPRLNTLICSEKHYNIPADVLSKVTVLSVSEPSLNSENMDNLIRFCSKNVEQLTVKCDRIQIIADNFRNLVHLETHIKIEDFEQLIKLRKIQSITALAASINQENVATFEQFLSANGGKLKYLWIHRCQDDVLNRAVKSWSAYCPNLICFKIVYGIKLKEIELETIKLLPPLEKITLDIFGFAGSSQDVEKLKQLLLRCKNSIRKVSLFIFNYRRLEVLPKVEQLNEMINILREHKRTVENNAQIDKPLSRIEMNGNPWVGSNIVERTQFMDLARGKMSFYY